MPLDVVPQQRDAPAVAAPQPPACPVKIIAFTVQLLIGLSISQAVPGWLAPDEYHTWQQVVKLMTMFCLSYIMISVGYEFDLDKSNLGKYGHDYCIAMTAAGFPWIFVAVWFVYVLPDPLPWKEALLMARFAAPTSAGILFSMLEAAGMKETWLFQKARVLAIFDDLDTILLMVPLKVAVVGLKWELSIDLVFVIVLLGLSWRYLHAVKIPVSPAATLCYAAIVTTLCELVHVVTHYHIDDMDTVHLEILLPAFAIGCIARSGHSGHRFDTAEQSPVTTAVESAEEQRVWEDLDGDAESKDGRNDEHHLDKQLQQEQIQRQLSTGTGQSSMSDRLSRSKSIFVEVAQVADAERIGTIISAVFMLLVGLSMPGLFGGDTGEEAHHRRLASGSSSSTVSSSEVSEQMPASEIAGHVAAVSILMIIGKMFPMCCYRSEVNLRTRFALSLGMCPRGEVGAGVIVISLGFGITGSSITIAVIALAINLILSSGFIMAVKHLASDSGQGLAQAHEEKTVQVTPRSARSEEARGPTNIIKEGRKETSRGRGTRAPSARPDESLGFITCLPCFRKNAPSS